MPKGTPVAGKVWPSPAVPIIGFTTSAAVKGSIQTAWPPAGFQRDIQSHSRNHGPGLDRNLGASGDTVVIGVNVRPVLPALGQKRERHLERARLAVVDGAQEPRVAFAARDGGELADPALEHSRLVPHGRHPPEELDLGFVLIVGGFVVPEDPLHGTE